MEKETYISKENLIYFLSLKSEKKNNSLFKKAKALTEKIYKNIVYFRGIIEISNVCEKNCFYCGLRKDQKIKRYTMTKNQIINCAKFCCQNNLGSILLQSGEVITSQRIEFLIDVIKTIKKKFNLGITLSLGELSKESLKDLFISGAHRYLLRIETSNKKLYNKIHPKDHSFENRLNTLEHLKSIGFQIGTGVMIGLPFQTYEDLANDLLFFKKIDIDMLGMGPYVPHEKTPLFKETINLPNTFELSLKMIALARLLLKDINIAAATALQTFNFKGREKALLCGANILMPIITPKNLRKHYSLYPNKPCLAETKETCLSCLKTRLTSIDRKIGYNKFGDSKHFFKRMKNR